MKTLINNIFYFKYYKECNNKLLVIGFLRILFKFKLFFYFNLKPLLKNER